MLRRQVAALQEQLADQAELLDARQRTISALEAARTDGEDVDQLRATLQRRDDTIRELSAQVERLTERPPESCPAWATPCRDGARCPLRGDAAHAMTWWHPPS